MKHLLSLLVVPAILLGACSTSQKSTTSTSATGAAAPVSAPSYLTASAVQSELFDVASVAKPLLSKNSAASLTALKSAALQVSAGQLPASQLTSLIAQAEPKDSLAIGEALAATAVAVSIVEQSYPNDLTVVEAYSLAVSNALGQAGF